MRLARPGDGARIVEWNLRLAEESEGLTLDAKTLARGVERVLADTDRGTYRIAELDGEPVGCLLVTHEWSDWRDGWWWWVQSVYVEPAARGRGIYDALHAAVIFAARERGDVVGLRLYVDKDNARAKRTYRRVGMDPSHYEVFEQPFG